MNHLNNHIKRQTFKRDTDWYDKDEGADADCIAHVAIFVGIVFVIMVIASLFV